MIFGNDNSISMIAGDNETITLAAENGLLLPGDTVIFTVKNGANALITKAITTFPDNSIAIDLSTADTEEIAPGRYIYGVKIVFANGEARHLIKPSLFELTAGV